MATTLDYVRQMAFKSGVFAPGAKAYFYQTGTTTPVVVYLDSDYSTAAPSPLVADAGGVFPQVFYNGSLEIRVVITDADDTTIYETDPAAKLTTSDSGAASISFSAITGNAATNVQDAVANNTLARENRSTAIKAFLGSADNAEARTNLALGDLAGKNESDYIQGQAVWNTGTATDESFITPAKLAGVIAEYFNSRKFTSTAQTTPTGDASVSVAHGLSSTPTEWGAYLVCTTTDRGYAVGDRLKLADSEAGAARSVMVWCNATNVGLSTKAEIFVTTKAGTSAGAITPGSWSLFFTASY
jgi:hypothetical protein